MNSEQTAEAWYCVRTKPKHEHIAAGNLRRHFGLEVFDPRLKLERHTERGIARLTESLFPGYIFVRCNVDDSLDSIRYAYGVQTLLRFGDLTPVIADSVITDLQACFPAAEALTPQDPLKPGLEVLINSGALAGMTGRVLRVLPSRQRVQVLLNFLGRPTEVEANRHSLTSETTTLADRLPFLAATRPELAEA